jgi:hypothetical protein
MLYINQNTHILSVGSLRFMIYGISFNPFVVFNAPILFLKFWFFLLSRLGTIIFF